MRYVSIRGFQDQVTYLTSLLGLSRKNEGGDCPSITRVSGTANSSFLSVMYALQEEGKIPNMRQRYLICIHDPTKIKYKPFLSRRSSELGRPRVHDAMRRRENKSSSNI